MYFLVFDLPFICEYVRVYMGTLISSCESSNFIAHWIYGLVSKTTVINSFLANC